MQRRELLKVGAAGVVGFPAALAVGAPDLGAEDLRSFAAEWRAICGKMADALEGLRGIDDRTPEGADQLDEAEEKLDAAVDRRIEFVEKLLDLHGGSPAVVAFKIMVAATIISEGGGPNFDPHDPEDRLALSAAVDALRLLHGVL